MTIIVMALAWTSSIGWGQTGAIVSAITGEELQLPVDPISAKLIDESIAALGAPRFEDRHRATRRLIDFGAPAFAKMRMRYLETDDLEVRSRIEHIVQIAFLDYHVYSNFGFLGIQKADFTPGPEEFPQIPEGHSGIAIKTVTNGSGADHAGLLPDDIIIALDGAPIPGAGIKAFENFSAWIRDRNPGAVVNLTVIRDKQQIEVQATLTRPVPNRDGPQINKLEEKLKAAKANFKVWWVRYFRSEPSPTEDND